MLLPVKNEPAKLAIFDLDGTLVDSLAAALAAYNAVAGRLGVRPVSEAEVSELRALGAMGVIRRLGLPLWKVPRVVVAVRAEMRRGLDEARPPAGVVAAVGELAASDCALAVLTSNSRENAERFLGRHAFPPFTEIVGGVGLFGKTGALRKLLRSRSVSHEGCVYVGDEVRDVVAAREAGIAVVAVGWGFNDLAALEGAGADALVDAPASLAQSVVSLLALTPAESSLATCQAQRTMEGKRPPCRTRGFG
jgi:phosphoglycolate phosphatase